MSLGSMEERTAGMKRQAKELIEQAYQRGFKEGYEKGYNTGVIDGYKKGFEEGYSNAETDYHAKTEDDRQSSYELGLTEAWEAAKEIAGDCLSGSTMTRELFNFSYAYGVFQNISASEAIEKLRKYEEKKQEEKKKEEEEIRVGDEVILNANSSYEPKTKAIVIVNDNSTTRYPYNVMVANGDTEWVDRDSIDRKTGRHFDEIAEVLKKMQEGE